MQLPIYIKEAGEEALPDDPMSFLVSRNGLFRNRATPCFSASVPCGFPPELAWHEATLEWKQSIPGILLEQVVGFFTEIDRRQPGAEAVALITFDATRGYALVVPEQTAIVALHPFGAPSPVRVRYRTPPLDGMVVGSVHSHSHEEAFESETDFIDSPKGLGLVVGRINTQREPPDLYATMAVDGYRFRIVDPLELFDGYERRRTDFPQEWLKQVRVRAIPAQIFHGGCRKHTSEEGGYYEG